MFKASTDGCKMFADKMITYYTYICELKCCPKILKSSTLDVRGYSSNALYKKQNSIGREPLS